MATTRRPVRRASSPSMQMMVDMMEEKHGSEVQDVDDIKYTSKPVEGRKLSRRASSPSMQMMQDMADDDSTPATTTPSSRCKDFSDLSAGLEELKITDAATDFSRQTTMDTDANPWSRQTSPQWSESGQSEQERTSPKDSPKRAPRRRASSPSMHLMQDMAGDDHEDETEENLGYVTKVLSNDRPRRRASSPSMQMMEDMAEEE